MPTRLDPADPSSPVTPSREDPVVTSATEWLGGPVGDHAVLGARGLLAACASLVAAVIGLVVAGVVERAHCLGAGWSSPDHFWHACYSDVPVVYSASTLPSGSSPFAAGANVDLPVPTATVAWLLARVVPGSATAGDAARWYFGLWSALTVALLVLLVGLLLRGQPRHPWRIAHLASPALPFLALVSFEVVPVTLTGAGLVAWGRRKPVLAGLLIGLACVARPVVVLGLLTVGLLALRAGRLGPWLRTAGTAVLTAALVLGLTYAAGLGDVLGPYRDWWSASAGYGSPWFLASLAKWTWPTVLLSVVAGLGWVLALGIGAVFVLSSRRRPRVGEAVLVVLALALILGKSVPVQAGLWMILLMALVGVRWRTHLAWAGVEVAYFVAVWLHIAAASDPNRGLPAGWYAVFLLARVGAWAWVVGEVWHRAAARPPAVPVERTAGAPVAAAAPTVPSATPQDGLGVPGVPVAPVASSDPLVVVGTPTAPAGAHPASAGPAGIPLAPTGAAALDAAALDAEPGWSQWSADVEEDDELAGPFAGRRDDTVITFV